MMYKWEWNDIHAGRRISSHNRANQSIIGYGEYADDENGNKWAVISLDDGLIIVSRKTKPELVAWLNEAGARPDTIITDDVS